MESRNRNVFLLVALLILSGAVAVAFLQKPKAPSEAVFTSLKGEKVSLADLRGKVVMVTFWATSCPGCVAEMPDLIRTYRKYQPQGLTAIAVAMSYDPPDYVLSYAERNALPFFVALDPQGGLARAFDDVRLTPTTFVLDKQGNIIQRTVGVLDFKQLEALLEKELKSS
jgi:peroxiredoxin